MKAVIFDFDGTIADSLAAIIKVLEDVMKRPRRFTPEEVKELQHKDPLEIARELGIPKWKIPWLLTRGRHMFRKHMRSITVHEGMVDVIKTLHKQGIPLFVLSSNSKANVQKYLRWHELDTFFANVYGGASLHGKSRKLRTLCRREGVDPTESWYIGDEIRDIIGGHTAGLRVIAVSWGYNTRIVLADKKPNALVDTPAEILPILNEQS